MKKILVILPYDKIYPPVNGGMLRCFHLVNQLAGHFEVSVIMNMPETGFRQAENEFPAVKKLRIHSTAAAPGKGAGSLTSSRLRNAVAYRWWKRTLKGPAEANFLLYYPLLKRILRKERFDLVLLENISTLQAVSVIRRYDRKVRLIYDAHNVDTLLYQAEVEKGTGSRMVYELIKKAESSLHELVDSTLVCSEKDLAEFQDLNNNRLQATVIPNGIWLNPGLAAADAVRAEKPEYLIFCGSLDYEPNVEGLTWFFGSIWPLLRAELPYLKIIVIGSGNFPSGLEKFRKDNSILFEGRVPEVRSYYARAAVAVVPLKTGSGTRLKVLEAMSMGVPVVSTPKGAEGIAYTEGRDILIAGEEQAFADRVAGLMRNKEQRIQIQTDARDLVEKTYDWNRIGERLRTVVETITHQK